MTQGKVLAAGVCLIGLSLQARPLVAQATVGADLDLFSSYVWRGLSLTNKPVAEPNVYLSFPAGSASITVGGWANIDLGKYDDPDDDISESGGLSAFNLAEFDPYAEISFPAGKATLTAGITGYIYPNELDDAPNGGLDSETNTWELYGTVGFDVPLAPTVTVYYDIDKVKGAYIEGSVSHAVPLNETLSLELAGLVGLSAGQGFDADDESFNFADDGLTHVDFSAGLPFTAGVFSITPVVHLQISADDATKFTSPTNDSDVKLWGGVSISWSRTLGPAPAEE